VVLLVLGRKLSDFNFLCSPELFTDVQYINLTIKSCPSLFSASPFIEMVIFVTISFEFTLTGLKAKKKKMNRQTNWNEICETDKTYYRLDNSFVLLLMNSGDDHTGLNYTTSAKHSVR